MFAHVFIISNTRSGKIQTSKLKLLTEIYQHLWAIKLNNTQQLPLQRSGMSQYPIHYLTKDHRVQVCHAVFWNAAPGHCMFVGPGLDLKLRLSVVAGFTEPKFQCSRSCTNTCNSFRHIFSYSHPYFRCTQSVCPLLSSLAVQKGHALVICNRCKPMWEWSVGSNWLFELAAASRWSFRTVHPTRSKRVYFPSPRSGYSLGIV